MNLGVGGKLLRSSPAVRPFVDLFATADCCTIANVEIGKPYQHVLA